MPQVGASRKKLDWWKNTHNISTSKVQSKNRKCQEATMVQSTIWKDRGIRKKTQDEIGESIHKES